MFVGGVVIETKNKYDIISIIDYILANLYSFIQNLFPLYTNRKTCKEKNYQLLFITVVDSFLNYLLLI